EARTRELTEALEQQTATSEILRVISSSPTDIQPVLDAVSENATRLCEAKDVSLALVEGDVLKVVASYGTMARWWPDEGIPTNRDSVTGRAFVDRQPVHVHDLAATSDEDFPLGKLYQRSGGHRTNLAIPLLREGLPIGVMASRSIDHDVIETLRAVPVRLGQGALGRAAETRQPVQFADITVPGMYTGPMRDALVHAGFRALLAVPILRESQIVGGLVVNRNTPGEFPPETVELLKTFGTQSALAIQNARLFREIEEKSRQLEVADRHKSEFLANMSHELRTPLNAVIGFSEVLLERMFGDLNPKQEEYLQDIVSSGRHLLSLINDILDLSKIEAGRMDLELTHFSVPLALENALTLIRERATRHGLGVDLAVDPGVGEIVGDERKVK